MVQVLIVKLFLSLGVDTKIRDMQGKTAIEVAITAKHQSLF